MSKHRSGLGVVLLSLPARTRISKMRGTLPNDIRPLVFRYGVAVLCVAVALALTLLLWRLMEQTPTPLFFAAVMISSWYGGLRPGLLSTALAALATHYLVLRSGDSPGANLFDILQLGVFVLVALLISSLTDARRRAQDALRQAHAQLEMRVEGRTAELAKANEELRAEITERARAQEEIAKLNTDLERRVKELQALFDTIPIGIAIAEDPECRRVRANPVNARLLGIAPDANASKGAPEVERPAYKVHQHGKELSGQELPLQVAAARGETVSGMEIEVLHEDGTTVCLVCYASPLFDEQGRVRGAVGAFLDITARKIAEEEHTQFIREQAARAEAEDARRRARFLSEAGGVLSASLDHETTLRNVARLALPLLADYCFFDVVTDDGKIQQVAWAHSDPAQQELINDVWRHMPPQEYEGHPIAKALSTGETEFVAQVTDAWRQERAINEGHLKLMRDLNFHSTLTVPLVARHHTLGALTFCLVNPGRHYTAADLELAEELARRAALAVDNARLYRQAQNASRAKDEFLATASHELRTPLTSMLIWVRMLKSGEMDAETSAHALQTIGENVKTLSQLINDLLDVSRVITGKLHLEPRPVDLIPIIEAAVGIVRPAATAKSIEIKTTLDTADRVLGDPDRLQQVLWNLLSNAIKFTPEHGRVEMRLEYVGSSAQITVKDTGAGISQKFLPRIFERLYQVEESKEGAGLGLGLAIVRHLVEMHGGTVSADSDGEGRGATFTVKLPLLAVNLEGDDLERLQPTVKEQASFSCSIRLDGLRVLVVDDKAAAREVITAVLEHCGARVIAAGSGAEALEGVTGAASHERPDVIVSDIRMPDGDGYDLIRKVRALGPARGGNIPAVALTAHAGIEDRVRALSAGFHAHLTKPVEPAEFVAVIASLTGNVGKAPAPEMAP